MNISNQRNLILPKGTRKKNKPIPKLEENKYHNYRKTKYIWGTNILTKDE